jgi:hypothetical protein
MAGAGTAAFVAVGALPDVAAGVVPGSVLSRPDGTGCGESGCELAAMAAAAIASGAVGPPEAMAAAGVVVAGVDVGTATATGVGVAGVLPTCWARMVASTAVASASSPLDFWSSGFVLPDVVAVVVDWPVPLAVTPLLLALAGSVALESSLDDGPLLAASLESLFACACVCGAGALLPAPLAALLLPLFAGAALLSDDGGGAFASFCWGGGGGGAAEESFGVFWLTRLPKRSFAGGVLERVSQDGAAWNAALAEAAASWVALSTGRSPAWELGKQSARTGPSKKYSYFNILKVHRAWFSPAFSARRQDLPSQTASHGRDCFARKRPILKCSFPAASRRQGA